MPIDYRSFSILSTGCSLQMLLAILEQELGLSGEQIDVKSLKAGSFEELSAHVRETIFLYRVDLFLRYTIPSKRVEFDFVCSHFSDESDPFYGETSFSVRFTRKSGYDETMTFRVMDILIKIVASHYDLEKQF